MELLLHYVWKHKMFPLKPLMTTDGQSVEVIDSGLHNYDAGPDFFNAKIVIGGNMWVGNVELHDKASDWYSHGHNKNDNYNNVVLHVVGKEGPVTITANNHNVPQLVLEIPDNVMTNYRDLLSTEHFPPCYEMISNLDRITIHSWMNYLQTERLQRKTEDIEKRVSQCNGSWEEALFITMARNYGFGVNGDAFEIWAQNIPLSFAARHRDDIIMTEALFMGQAGLLDINTIPEMYRAEAEKDGYFNHLLTEYRHLSHMFNLTPIDVKLWKFLRMRPQNFPHIRISELAELYHSRRNDLSKLIECKDVIQIKELLKAKVTPYWETHYTFGSTSCKTSKSISDSSLNLIVINTAIPMLFAYGKHRQDERLCNRAFDMLNCLKPEINYITRAWDACGIKAENAGDSQALIQLKKEYCDKRNCLRCRFGYEYLKRKVK